MKNDKQNELKFMVELMSNMAEIMIYDAHGINIGLEYFENKPKHIETYLSTYMHVSYLSKSIEHKNYIKEEINPSFNKKIQTLYKEIQPDKFLKYAKNQGWKNIPTDKKVKEICKKIDEKLEELVLESKEEMKNKKIYRSQ